MGDGLVRQTLDEGGKDLSLTRGQAFKAFACQCVDALLLFDLTKASQRTANAFDKTLGIEWFFDEVDNALFHQADGQRHIGVGGDDQDGPCAAFVGADATNDFNPVHLGHAHIGDDAGGFVLRHVAKEVSTTGKGAAADALTAQQHDQRVAHTGIVINNEN